MKVFTALDKIYFNSNIRTVNEPSHLWTTQEKGFVYVHLLNKQAKLKSKFKLI